METGAYKPRRWCYLLYLLYNVFFLFQDGQLRRRYQQADRSWLSAYSADQSLFFQFQNHLVNARGCNLKVSFQVSFGWCAAVNLRVVVNKGKVLPLFLRKIHFHLNSGGSFPQGLHPPLDFSVHFLKGTIPQVK